MQFLHYGLPKRPMTTIYTPSVNKEPLIPKVKDFTKPLLSMLSRLNIAGYEFISQQYDYIVQGNLSLPPFQGRGRINADASVIKPVLNSSKGLIMSQGIYPSYSDIDTYHMVAACIDTAIRNVVAAGGNLEKIALLDNFCWCSSNDSFRLGQLKRAVRACYDYATYYQTPFISGKDSMFNDFKGFDSDGKPIKISILPTLLITSIGVVDEITKVVSLDLKFPDDLIYILGKTDDELGASEYYAMVSESLNKKYIGNSVPKVDAERNKRLYQALNIAIQQDLVTSSISVGRGGIAVALAKGAMGGMLGIEVTLQSIPGEVTRDDFALFSESQGRIIVSIDSQNKEKFEKVMDGNSFACIGKVRNDKKILIKGLKRNIIVRTDADKALKSYRKTFKGY